MWAKLLITLLVALLVPTSTSGEWLSAIQNIIPEAEYTGDHDTFIRDVHDARGWTGGYLIITVTDDPAAASVVFSIYLARPDGTKVATGTPLMQTTAIDSVVIYVAAICTSAGAGALGVNLASDFCLPSHWVLEANHADGDAITYKVDMHYTNWFN
jgi:hypothetical protein